ncbi:MAG: efflux RND transporter periplasmic adaptor subunit [Pseudomonadota bacterium]
MAIDFLLSRARLTAAAATLCLFPGCSSEETTTEKPAAALPVVTQAVRYSDEIDRQETLTGRVEANRASDVGFELAGQLVSVGVDEGDTVAKGDVLARLDTARLQARKAEIEAVLRQSRAQATLARTTLSRVREAVSFNGVSQQEVDEAENAVNTAEAAIAASESRLASVRVDFEKSLIRAPYNAIITARHVDEGQVMAPGQAVLSMQEADAMLLRVGVASAKLNELAPGTVHTVTLNGRDIDATVSAVLPQRDPVARTVDVLFTLPPSAAVRAGDLGRLSLSQSQSLRGVWLPLDALAEGRRGLWNVYVAAPEAQQALGATHRVTPRPVDVVYQNGEQAFVRGPLEDGEPVIVGGLQRIVPGQYVRIERTVAQP